MENEWSLSLKSSPLLKPVLSDLKNNIFMPNLRSSAVLISRNSIVDILTRLRALWATNRVSIPGRGVQISSEFHSASSSGAVGVSLPVGKPARLQLWPF
jgi:hypothetical protein